MTRNPSLDDLDGQRLHIDGVAYGRNNLQELPTDFPGLREFFQEWFADEPCMRLRTSGSTGKPMDFLADKKRMRQSARMTCTALGLLPGQTALLCLPLRFIAGMMMLVRGFVGELDLHLAHPSGRPLAVLDQGFDFAAMTPMQVYNCLRFPTEKKRLRRIGTLLIGGAGIDPALERELTDFPGAVFATYGMTETLSHIALRRVSGPGASKRYVPLPAVSLSLSSENTLVIEAPLLCQECVITKDLVRLHQDGSFEVLGRLDNVINSGGIKIQAEDVESRIAHLFEGPFAVTALPHKKFGQAVALLVQTTPGTGLEEKIRAILPPTMRPKVILQTDAIPMTPNGKIRRAECRELALAAGQRLKRRCPGPPHEWYL